MWLVWVLILLDFCLLFENVGDLCIKVVARGVFVALGGWFLCYCVGLWLVALAAVWVVFNMVLFGVCDRIDRWVGSGGGLFCCC